MKAPTLLLCAFLAAALGFAIAGEDDYRPHTPTLVFHLTHAAEAPDQDAIRASVQKLASVLKVAFVDDAVQVRFDSHVVSYHQVAQAISEGGQARGKTFDPFLKLSVPEYAQGDHAAKVDALLAGKRLNQRIHVATLDKAQGEFAVHFLPLVLDPADKAPQGFNGGHLHHPINDPPPRGLGLKCDYESGAAPAAK